MKPLIGITCNYESRDTVGIASDMGTPGQDWNFVAGDYIYAIEQAGGIPVVLPRCEDPSTLTALLDRLDGILLSGGHDVDPPSYGAERQPWCGQTEPLRDAMDLTVIRYALNNRKPLLAICRGMQLLNAALGGTVWQDVQKEGDFLRHSWGRFVSGRQETVHTVTLAEGSLLHRIFGHTSVAVNSFHHQAVREPGLPVAVTAISEDGVAEGIEISGCSAFTVGVQWHPEMMYDSHEQKKLFSGFVEACCSSPLSTEDTPL